MSAPKRDQNAVPLNEQDRELMMRWIARVAADTPIRAEIARWLLKMPEPCAVCHQVAGFVVGYRA